MQKRRPPQTIAFLGLAATVLGWGLTWPVNKLLLAELSPIWMLTLRMAIASATLFLIGLFSKTLALPPRADLRILASVALLHMVGFGALGAIGLSIVSTGRSVLLAYTFPIWVLPGAAIILRERITFTRLAAVGLGIGGLLVLVNPANLDWHDDMALLGNFSLIAAALLWAINIIHIRLHKWQSTPLVVAPWEALLAGSIFALTAILFFEVPDAHWDVRLVALLIFSGVFGTAVPFWAASVASRGLPAATTSLGLLATPIVSMMTSVIVLGEEITPQLMLASILIFCGMLLAMITKESLP